MNLPTRGWQGRWGGIEERPMKHYATDEEFEADTGRKVHPSMKGELAKAAARRKEEMERRASARPYEPAMRMGKGEALSAAIIKPLPRPRTYPKGMITKDIVGVDIRRDIPVST